jgi:O-antigen/teichoic acid export membrane protein
MAILESTRPLHPTHYAPGLPVGQRLVQMALHTATYGLVPALSRIASFLLLPVYTKYLSPAEYGALEVVMLASTLVNLFVGLEIVNSVVRLYHSYDAERDKQEVVSTAMIFTGAVTAAAIIVADLARYRIASGAFGDASVADLLRLAFYTLVFENIVLVLYAYMQARKLSFAYTAVWVAQVTATLSLNVLFVVGFRSGVAGILTSQLIVNAILAVGLAVWAIRAVGLRFSMAKMRSMLTFGVPLIGVSVGVFARNAADRSVLVAVASLADVGLYSLGNRFASLLVAFVILPFSLLWNAERFEIAKHRDGNEMIARVFTYFVVLLCCAGLAVSVFIDGIVRLMTAPDFWPAARIGPVLVLAYGLSGIFAFLTTGALVARRSGTVGLLSVLGSLGHVGLCVLGGTMFLGVGVAWANVITYSLLCVGAYITSQWVYPIPFEIGRVTKAVCTAVALFAASTYVTASVPLLEIAWKAPIVMAFPAVLAGLGFLDARERRWLAARIKALVSSVRLAPGAR